MSIELFNKEVKIIELDALLDTRLTIYKEMGINIDAIFQAGYRNRVYDRFPGVDYERYIERYKNRDNDLLLAATVTELPYKLASEGAETYDIKKEMGLVKINEIWINTYPYDLDESQRFEIGRAVSHIMRGSGYNIKVVNHTYEEMTLDWMKENHVRAFYIYQYEEWVMANDKKLINNNNSYAISIIAPWLITTELDDELSNKLDEITSAGTSIPNLLKGHFALWFSLELTKARFFSSIVADDIYPDYVED